jgi:hypothetical protein
MCFFFRDVCSILKLRACTPALGFFGDNEQSGKNSCCEPWFLKAGGATQFVANCWTRIDVAVVMKWTSGYSFGYPDPRTPQSAYHLSCPEKKQSQDPVPSAINSRVTYYVAGD